jgi:hypothetical protein
MSANLASVFSCKRQKQTRIAKVFIEDEILPFAVPWALVDFCSNIHYFPSVTGTITPSLGRGGPPGCIYICSKSVTMEEDLFVTWPKYFISNLQPSIQKHLLLITDKHSSHTTSLSIYKLCKDIFIIVVSIPHRASHKGNRYIFSPFDLLNRFPTQNAGYS